MLSFLKKKTINETWIRAVDAVHFSPSLGLSKWRRSSRCSHYVLRYFILPESIALNTFNIETYTGRPWGPGYLIFNGVLLTIVTGGGKRKRHLRRVFIFRSASALCRNNSRINLEWVTLRLDPRQSNAVKWWTHCYISPSKDCRIDKCAISLHYPKNIACAYAMDLSNQINIWIYIEYFSTLIHYTSQLPKYKYYK